MYKFVDTVIGRIICGTMWKGDEAWDGLGRRKHFVSHLTFILKLL